MYYDAHFRADHFRHRKFQRNCRMESIDREIKKKRKNSNQLFSHGTVNSESEASINRRQYHTLKFQSCHFRCDNVFYLYIYIYLLFRKQCVGTCIQIASITLDFTLSGVPKYHNRLDLVLYCGWPKNVGVTAKRGQHIYTTTNIHTPIEYALINIMIEGMWK